MLRKRDLAWRYGHTMKVDVHMTTCHHSTVKCRPRTNDYNIENFNITEWTQLEKLEIAKISAQSLREFAGDISIVDDGSDLPEAIEWLATQKNVYSYPHRGSGSALNSYHKRIPAETDLICHFEDDHVYYNPEKLDWAKIAHDFLVENPSVGVVTLISGLPNRPDYPDYNGAWGPVGFMDGKVPALLFNCMGNAHHIMLKKTYDKFFPLVGSSGACEAYMNRRLAQLRLKNAELQIPVYAFHSHCLNRQLPVEITTNELNMSPRGREYGIADMYRYIKSNIPIEYSYMVSQYKEHYVN